MTGFDPREFVAGFIAEAEEHLAAASTNLLSMERSEVTGQAAPRQTRELFRSFHTIKGLAAMVGVEPIVEIAHAMETVLREADRAAGRLPAGSVELLLQGVRAVEVRVTALARGERVPPAPPVLLEALNDVRAEESSKPAEPSALSLGPELGGRLSAAETEQLTQGLRAGRRGLVIHFAPTPERARGGINITSVRERLGAIAEIVKVVPRALPVGPEAPGGLSFALIVLTSAAEDAVDAISGSSPREPIRLTDPETDPGSAAGPGVVEDARADPQQPESEDALEALEAADPNGGSPGDGPGRGDAQLRGHVRVPVERLDDALERLSALVVTQFRLTRATAELRARGAEVRGLELVVAESARQLRDLRGAIMRARMVSVAQVLERVPLLVRGLGRATGKSVRVELRPGQAELDKAVAERVFPAVVHLVRNAVDHGLEPPEERQAAGKSATGLIRVSCQGSSGNQMELTVADDGRGIDAEAVAARAGEPIPRTAEALLAMLARPGLSTKTEVTTTSGRGMGMDVVKRITVDELGGDLTVETNRGAGTTFTLRIPLSISIVEAFSFSCAGQTFVVPVAMVDEIREIDVARVVRGPDRRRSPRGPDRRRGWWGDAASGPEGPGAVASSGAARSAAGMMMRRGEAVPILPLYEVFGLTAEAPLPASGSGLPKAIVVRRNGHPFAFTVDRMLGRQEIVVRPIEDALVRVEGVAGTTDLGDGRPTLVLDLGALASRMLTQAGSDLST